MKKKMFMKSVSAAVLVLGVSTYSFAAGDGAPEPADSLLGIFQEGALKGKIRTLFFDRDFDQNTEDWSTIGVGVHLNYETAPMAGLTAGIGFKTGQGAEWNSDDDGVYGGMLPKDEDGNAENYAALDEYFLRYRGFDTTVTLGAQNVFTPAMLGHYIRLTEKKYRGIGVKNKSIENLEIQGYYITDYMGWTDEEFKSVTSGFTKNEDDDEGALIGGLIWTAPSGLKLQAWDYYYPEVMNQYYVRGQYAYKMNDDLSLSCELRYFGLADTGDALAGEIDTYSAGAIFGLNGYGFSLTGYYANNGDGAIPTPFDAPLPILMQVSASNAAELDAYGVKLGYDLSKIGATGLSAYVFYTSFDTPDDGDTASPDVDEIDFNLTYKFSGWAKNASLRVRYAILDKDESAGGEDLNDFRVYLDFSF